MISGYSIWEVSKYPEKCVKQGDRITVIIKQDTPISTPHYLREGRPHSSSEEEFPWTCPLSEQAGAI